VSQALIATKPISTPNGGYRVTAATGDRHAARLAIRSMGDPIEYLRPTLSHMCGACVQMSQFWRRLTGQMMR
jgi:hypothetical protein